jgi:dephospho-CoA kinase
MLKIGLTGGIGCGKTTVAQLFAQEGVPVIDADVIAHQLVQPGQPALKQIQALWGDGILKADGCLDRAKLREIVFAAPEEKQRLENLLHPLVYAAIEHTVQQLSAKYCLICVPLLLETAMTDRVDRVLVVDCPVETQILRVRERDQLPIQQIQAIIDSQVPRDYRLAKADDVIANIETNDKLAEQVKKLHNLYLSLSHCQD